jgi:hypothetical protein
MGRLFSDNVQDMFLERNAKGAQQTTTEVDLLNPRDYGHGDFYQARVVVI